MLCTFLYTGEQLAANPMQLVGRPKLARCLPKALPRTAVEALLETVAQDRDSQRQTAPCFLHCGMRLVGIIGYHLTVSLPPLPTLPKTEFIYGGGSLGKGFRGFRSWQRKLTT